MNKTYTISQNGYIQAYSKTDATSGYPFIRLYVNNICIYENVGVTGSYKYAWSPLFKVYAGDILKYTLTSETKDGWKHLRLYR